MSWITGWWKGEKKEEKSVLKDGVVYMDRDYVIENKDLTNRAHEYQNDEIGYGFVEAYYKPFKAQKYLNYGNGYIYFYYTGTYLGASGSFSYRFIFNEIVVNNYQTLSVLNEDSKNYSTIYIKFIYTNGGSGGWPDPNTKKKEYRADKVSIILEQTKDANTMFSEENKIGISRFYRETEDDNKKVSLTVNYGLSIRDYLMINGICPDYNTSSKDKIKITVSGEIPLWVYENLLPLSTKGYVDEQGNVVDDSYTGTKYQILGINDAFYENIDSSIDFGERTDIDFERFENFYVKNVKLSISYYGQTLPFQYYEDGVLKGSNIEYYSEVSEDIASISNVDYILTIHFNPQTENDFLDKYIKEESGNKILEFNVVLTDLDEQVQSLTDISFRGNLIVIDQMIREENGSTFTIECCSEQIQGIRIICSTGTIECPVFPDYKITNLYCINTDDLDLNNELPEVDITLSTQQYISLTYDNLYLTNLKKEGATNTNLLLEGDITSLYQYLPFKRSKYPEGYPELLMGIDTINDSPVPNEYLDANISMCLIDIEDANDIDISKFGEGINEEDGSIVNQNVFISSILAYDNADIKDKFTKSKLKSRNQAVSHGKTLGDGEVVYADTRYRFGNPNLVQSVTTSGEDEYSAIRLNFANQYDSGFLDSELVEDGDDWNLIIDLNNKPTDPNDPESPSTSDQFRSMMDSNDKLLLYVERMETIKDLYFFDTTKTIKNVKVYYYDENGEYVSEPWTLVKTSENFKTKVSEMYWAYVQSIGTKNYLVPDRHYFDAVSKIHVYRNGVNYINIIDNLYTTGSSINRNSTSEDPKEIRAQKINLFVDGTIPAWVFKEVLPLKIEVKEGNVTKIYYKFINTNSDQVYLADEHGVDDLQIIGINDKPNIENVLFPTVGTNDYIGSSIDLSNVLNGTAVANISAFDRISIGSNKVFFVNKVTLLKRFKEKIDIEGVFQYYEGEPTIAKNCDPSKGEITYEDDWALKLPECYEGCKIDEDDAAQLVMKFGTYEQFDPDAYLLENVISSDMYLDVSMSINDVSNISKVKIYLEKLKYFNSQKTNSYEIDFYREFRNLNILFNENGFIGTKQINYDFLTNVIDKCYVIGGTSKLENSIRLVEPLKNAFMIYDNKKCIAIPYSNFVGNFITINSIKCTNTQDYALHSIKSTNLLVAGEIPTWIMEYMPLPIKLNFVTYNSNYGYIYELSEDKTNMTFSITSVNALPTPDGDVGIDNVN